MCTIEKRPLLSRPFEKDRASQPASKQANNDQGMLYCSHLCLTYSQSIFIPSSTQKILFVDRRTTALLWLPALIFLASLCFDLAVHTNSQPASRPYVEFCSVLFSSVEFSSVVSVQSIRIQLKFLVQYYVACIVEYLLWLVACVSLVLVWSGL